ncbi:MAG: hypothetical protein ACD_28C00184G0001, partial [uncultured bacterium]
LAASVFHYGKFTVGQVKEYLAEKGVAVRGKRANSSRLQNKMRTRETGPLSSRLI